MLVHSSTFLHNLRVWVIYQELYSFGFRFGFFFLLALSAMFQIFSPFFFLYLPSTCFRQWVSSRQRYWKRLFRFPNFGRFHDVSGYTYCRVIISCRNVSKKKRKRGKNWGKKFGEIIWSIGSSSKTAFGFKKQPLI